MHDESYWKDPYVFRPERFIDETTGKVKPDERLIPFGLGKRACLGKSLAQTEVYLFLARMIQQFTMKHPADVNPPQYLEPKVAGLLTCPDYRVIISERV